NNEENYIIYKLSIAAYKLIDNLIITSQQNEILYFIIQKDTSVVLLDGELIAERNFVESHVNLTAGVPVNILSLSNNPINLIGGASGLDVIIIFYIVEETTITFSLTSEEEMQPQPEPEPEPEPEPNFLVPIIQDMTIDYSIVSEDVQLLNEGTSNNVSMQNPYLFNDVPYANNNYIGVGIGSYTLTGVTSAHPLGFVINDTSLFEVISGTEFE
ncbi:MAG: hypothetical protein QF806_08790, partial [Pseudomonadales bacterium]|nr:hypothetical protein [Pseudomonadales bacterium]